MVDLGKISLGSLLVALGVAYILKNAYIVSSYFWTFVGVFLILEGLINSLVDLIKKTKREEIEMLFILFVGASILIIQLGIINYSHFVMFILALGSLGLASLISGAFFHYSIRHIFAGIIMIAIAVFFLMPPVLKFSETVQNTIRQFGIGILLIALGLIIFLPSRKKG